MNYCTNCQFGQVVTRAVYDKGRKVGEIEREFGDGAWCVAWFLPGFETVVVDACALQNVGEI